MNEPTNTESHADHVAKTSLLDSLGFDTTDGRQSLRDTGGTLGVAHVGDEFRITTYNTKDDTHRGVLNKQGKEIIFSTEEDSRDFIRTHNQRLKDSLIIEESSPPSIGDLERAAKSKARRAEERRTGAHIQSGPLLG